MDEQQHRLMARSQGQHWWFRGRRLLINALIRRYLASATTTPQLLEIGAGTGSNLGALSLFGDVTAVEPGVFAAGYLREKYPNVTCVQAEWPAIAGSLGRFDAVLLMDVLEHLDDDALALRAVRDHVQVNGIVIVSVPAYQSMWSEHDELLWHKRRYSRSQLKALVTQSGFEVVHMSGFNWFMLPVAWLARRLRLGFATGDTLPPAPMNRALAQVLRFEVWVMAKGVHAPFGLSIIAVLRGSAP